MPDAPVFGRKAVGEGVSVPPGGAPLESCGFCMFGLDVFADGVIAVRHNLVKRTLLFHTIREGAEELATRPTRVSRLTRLLRRAPGREHPTPGRQSIQNRSEISAPGRSH